MIHEYKWLSVSFQAESNLSVFTILYFCFKTKRERFLFSRTKVKLRMQSYSVQWERKQKSNPQVSRKIRLEKRQRSGVQLSERLAPLGYHALPNWGYHALKSLKRTSQHYMRCQGRGMKGVLNRAPAHRNIFEILLNQIEIRLYLTCFVWYGTKRTSVWIQINRKMVISFWLNKISKIYLCVRGEDFFYSKRQ